jgi:cytochrome c peroxidase
MNKLKSAVCVAFVIAFGAFMLVRSGKVEGHEAITTLSPPTGFSASDSVYRNKVGLYWDVMRGATLYRVFRNTVNDPSTATDIGTTVENTFRDTTATPGQTFFYWVRSEDGSGASDLSIADQGTRTNTQQQGPVPPLEGPPVPAGNAVTGAKVYLGKTLFWDEQLSSTRTVACGTCHHSGTGGADPRSVQAATLSLNPGPDQIVGTADDIRGSQGVPSNNVDGTYNFLAPYGLNDQVTGRKAVSYVNAGYQPLLFWDGRATGTFRDPITNAIILNTGAALESQVLGPPVSTGEMAHFGRDWNDVAARVAASKPLALSPSIPTALVSWIGQRTYPELFEEAFGTSDVTPSRIAMAIATFERTLYTDRAPVDLDAAGITPLTAQEQRGRGVFNASNCNVCHAGNLFTDNTFRYIGVRPQNDDLGRFTQTNNNNDRGSFRVPSLRNVELRQSFFHNGQFTTLEQVVAFYNRGGDFGGPNKPGNLIRPLGLSANQQADLVAFLKRPLTDQRVVTESERFDRPLLYMESTRVPLITGTGREGSGSFLPLIKAISPPIGGNPNFTVSVTGALGNANAVLVITSADPGVGATIPAGGNFARVVTTTQNTGAGNGWASVSVPVPSSILYAGKTFYARWYIEDPGAVNGFSVSQVAKFTVYGRPRTSSYDPGLIDP